LTVEEFAQALAEDRELAEDFVAAFMDLDGMKFSRKSVGSVSAGGKRVGPVI
jgi:hypothetical protein